MKVSLETRINSLTILEIDSHESDLFTVVSELLLLTSLGTVPRGISTRL